MVRVKICGVTNVEDACLAAELGASAIGLNFYAKSPRYVDLASAERIVEALPAGVCRVGVFVDEERERVREIADRLHLDALQFHGAEPAEYCRGWSQKVIKAVRVRGPEALAQAADYPVDFILADAYVEGHLGGTGRQIPRDWLGGFERRRLILAGGLRPQNVAQAVADLRPAAVDVASGVEKTPRKKDPELVRKFIENAKSA